MKQSRDLLVGKWDSKSTIDDRFGQSKIIAEFFKLLLCVYNLSECYAIEIQIVMVIRNMPPMGYMIGGCICIWWILVSNLKFEDMSWCIL